jgi:hypothetical protein
MCCTDKTSTNQNENGEGNFQSMSLFNPIIVPAGFSPFYNVIYDTNDNFPAPNLWEPLDSPMDNPLFAAGGSNFKLPRTGVYAIYIKMTNSLILALPNALSFFHLRLRDEFGFEYFKVTVPVTAYEFYSTTVMVHNLGAGRTFGFEIFQTIQGEFTFVNVVDVLGIYCLFETP